MTAPEPPAAAPGADPIEPAPTSEPGRIARFRRTRWWRWGRWPLAAFVLVGLVGIGLFAYLYATVSLPDEPPELESSVVVDAHGRQLAVFAKDGLRVPVDLEQVSPIVVKSLIAAEDRDFRSHDGVDPRGLARAAFNNLRGRATQGGSTITQQLVKNMYLSPERSYGRKVKEAVLAIKLERTMSKDEILERYLNTVYFGRGAYGIEAASRTWFDTHANKLTVPQAALLIGLLRAPESGDPAHHRDVALRRRNSVIEDLADVGDLTRAEAKAFERVPIETAPRKSQVTLRAGVGAHAIEWIRRQAIDRFGEEVVYGGGLVIHSTLDLDQQRAAEQAVHEVLDRPDDPQAALVAIDRDGAIRAHVGGRDYGKLEVDLARGASGGGSGRQAGSSFKPIVLATALERHVATLGTTYPGPAQLELDANGTPWKVGNYGGERFGTIDLATATAHSVNTTYAQLMLDVGPPNVVDTALALGIRSRLHPNPSLVLGTGEVSVVDMADAYSTFARDGRHVDPYLIAEVTDGDGHVLYRAHPDQGQAIQPGTAHAVTSALEGVIDEGTGTGAAIGRPAAGKTGTTQNNGDAWFAGYTPDLTAAVWMGYPEGPQHTMDDVHGRSVTGGSFPAEIWKRFMERALAKVPPKGFPPPPEELVRPLRAPSRPERTTSAPSESTTTTTTEPTTSTTTTAPTKGKPKGDGGPPKKKDPKPADTTTTTTAAPTTTSAPPTTVAEPAPATAEPPPA